MRHLYSALESEEGHHSFLNVYMSFQALLFKTGALNQLTWVRNEAVSEPFLFSFFALLSLCFQVLSVSLPSLNIKWRTRSLFHRSDGKVSVSGFDDKYCTQKIAQWHKRCWKETVWAVYSEESLFHWRKWFMFVQSSFIYVCHVPSQMK